MCLISYLDLIEHQFPYFRYRLTCTILCPSFSLFASIEVGSGYLVEFRVQSAVQDTWRVHHKYPGRDFHQWIRTSCPWSQLNILTRTSYNMYNCSVRDDRSILISKSCMPCSCSYNNIATASPYVVIPVRYKIISKSTIMVTVTTLLTLISNSLAVKTLLVLTGYASVKSWETWLLYVITGCLKSMIHLLTSTMHTTVQWSITTLVHAFFFFKKCNISNDIHCSCMPP